MTDLDSNYLSAILEQSDDGYIFTDTDGIITRVNPTMLKILGMSENKLVGEHFDFFINIVVRERYGKYDEKRRADIRELLTGRKPIDFQFVSWIDRFNQQWILDSLPLADSSERIIRIRQGQNAWKTILEHIGHYAHLIKKPLTSIQGYSDLFLEGITSKLDDGEVSKIKTIIKNNYAEIRNLREHYYDFVTMQAGTFKIEIFDIRETTLTKLFDFILKPLRPHSITLQIEDNIPPLWIDGTRIIESLRQIIQLLTKKQELPQITISQQTSQQILIEISNDVEVRSDIFDSFHLFRAKHVIEAHNGEIWFESEEGVGTTFFIRLPIKQIEDENK